MVLLWEYPAQCQRALAGVSGYLPEKPVDAFFRYLSVAVDVQVCLGVYVAYFEFKRTVHLYDRLRHIGPKDQLTSVFALVEGALAISAEAKSTVFGRSGRWRRFKLRARVAKTT